MIEHIRSTPGRKVHAAGILLALVPAAMLLWLLLRSVWDVDIFWQLKLGELILDRPGPISHEPFSALHLGDPMPSVAWAGQALMALARRVGGWDLLRVVDALCWLGGFWAVAAACRLRGAAMPAVMLALVLTFIAALPTASIRPQSFACLCFGLLLALQRLGLRPLLTIALGAPLLVAWQNLHPSVSVGVIAMGLASLPGWIAWVGDRSRTVPVATSVLALIGAAAVFATPDGISIIQTSATNAEASIAIGASEWLPLWISGNRLNAVPVLVTVLLAARLVMGNRRRIDAGELATAIGLLLMTITAYRFVLFWAVAMVPVIARAGAEPDDKRGMGGGWGTVRVVGPILLVTLFAPLLAPTRFASTLPLAAVERLRKEGVRGTVYGDFPFGGAIIDAGYPAWHVAYDGRYYRYSRKEWQYNGGIENGIVPLVDVVHKWQPAAFVLDATHNAPLAGELAHSREWRRIWSRDGIVVYVPRRL
ncbi:hypothetical protein [Novosphingobium sp. P6W]|uniref:hypothetical protein n=1 Tax=Novosphingobium sp. P6W TaxID=1609758 RepID=UPI0005C2D48C|nr:hypothetical protein [Novosphingobium sp. P6W]AXB76356.1 hypothetical protein TQ38_007415 [Novosphingobium sp. P6W]KIS32143.1 hypothetical protein TQ38_13380 [Novosphingobium sp. P6W]